MTESRLVKLNDIETYDPNPTPMLNPQDLVSLGSHMTTNGLTTLESRALIAQLQQLAAQTALLMAPEILEKVRRVQEARMHEILAQVSLLTGFMGLYVRKDQVQAIITRVMSTVPRQ
jgi:hypothetical protein